MRQIKKKKYYSYKTTYIGQPIKEPLPIKFFLSKFKKSIFWVLILGSMLYFIFLSNYFKVKNIEISGINDQNIITKINEYKGKNIFLVNFEDIENDIIAQDINVNKVNLIRGIPDTLRINTSNRIKSMVWVSANINYVLDENGRVFAQVKELPEWNNAEIPIVKDGEPREFGSGQKVASTIFIEQMKNIKKDFNTKTNLTIKEVAISNSTFQIHITTINNWIIKLNMLEDVDFQLANLGAIVKSNKPVTTYIDLRVPGLAYYK